MIRINSISGGKSSSYLSLHFGADVDVFALVEAEVAIQHPKSRRSLTVAEKKAFSWVRQFAPGFWATAEDNRTLIVLHKLHEELAARPSQVEVGGTQQGLHLITANQFSPEHGIVDFDTLIAKKNFLPNARKRTCTQYLKIEPTYHYTTHPHYLNQVEPVQMALGYRPDEVQRTVSLYYKVAPIAKRKPNPGYDLTEAFTRFGLPEYLRRWWEVLEVEKQVRAGVYVEKEINFNQWKLSGGQLTTWRYPVFPLIEHGVTHGEIVKYWLSRPDYNFPPISNCVGCFHHRVEQLQTQWQTIDNYGKMEWMARREEERGYLFGRTLSYRQIQRLPYQLAIDFNSAWTSCDSGACTD